MSLYPESIARCQHLKVNGTQCGSPALRKQRFCYFHKDWRQKRLQINVNIRREQGAVTLPVLEDANSIQVALMQVMRLLLTAQIEHRTAGLLLYALQTASANIARTTFEPELPTRVVIDRATVARRPIGPPPGPSPKIANTTIRTSPNRTSKRTLWPRSFSKEWASPTSSPACLRKEKYKVMMKPWRKSCTIAGWGMIYRVRFELPPASKRLGAHLTSPPGMRK